MAEAGRVDFVISVTGDAARIMSQQIQQITGASRQAGDAATQAGARYNAWLTTASNQASNLTNQLLGVVGVSLTIAGAAYAMHKAWSAWYSLISSGIKAIDEYNMTIFGTAGIMATMSEASVPKDEAYAAWKKYLDWLRTESNIADREAAASGREIFETAAAMAQRGTVAMTREQVKQIANFTDEIKSQIKGMAGGGEFVIRQINQEIRALFEGRVAAGSQMAMLFQKLDANWKENFQNAVQTGTVLDYINSVLPRIEAKTKDIGNTWESVSSSLENVKGEILRAAFGPAYQDIINWGKQVIDQLYQEGQLTADGERLAQALGEAWRVAGQKIKEALDYFINNSDKVISDVSTIASAVGMIASAAARATVAIVGLFSELSQLAANPLVQMMMGAAVGSRFGPWGAAAGATLPAAKWLSGMGIPGYEMQTFGMPEAPSPPSAIMEGAETFYGPAPSVPKPAPPVPKLKPIGIEEAAGKAGKAAADTARQIENLIDTLNKELARLTEGSLAEISSWYDHVLRQIERYATSAQEAQEAVTLAGKVRAAKEQKVYEDFNKWFAGATHDRIAAAELEEQELLRKYAGVYGAREAIVQATDAKIRQIQIDTESERLNLMKGYLGELGSIAPLLADQFNYQSQVLSVEKQLAALKLEEAYWAGKITLETYDQARAMQAVVDQAKAFQLQQKQWQTQGISGGWQAYGLKRQTAAETRGYDMFLETMQALEQEIGAGMADAFIGWMRGRQGDLSEVFFKMAESATKRMFEGLTSMLFDALAPKPIITPVITAGALNVATINAGVTTGISTGGAGGLLSGVFDWVKGLFGFQHGGSFTVGGHGGYDSQVVAFRATPGEKVSITPPGKAGYSGGEAQQHVTINSPVYIQASEPSRYHASREQLEARRAQNIRRALRNI